MKTVLAVALASSLACAALAHEVVIRIGGASIKFDRTRWQASASDNSVTFMPQGEAARDHDPVTLNVFDGAETCAVLVQRAFAFGHYDLEAIEHSPMRVGGIDGERFATHTRCRNATPRGEIACIRAGGRTYLVQALQPGCGGRNLFSGPDPLYEIAAGIDFAPP